MIEHEIYTKLSELILPNQKVTRIQIARDGRLVDVNITGGVIPWPCQRLVLQYGYQRHEIMKNEVGWAQWHLLTSGSREKSIFVEDLKRRLIKTKCY